MAIILPMSTDLSEELEESSIDVTFTAQLQNDETLVAINIISYEATPGINVLGNRLYGTYQSVFNIGNDALRYRQGNDLKVAASWEQLPPPKTADLYLWRAPSSLEKTFRYTVELVYMWQGPATVDPTTGAEVSPAPVERKLQKVYFQRVVGNWSKWANQLRAYVYAGQ